MKVLRPRKSLSLILIGFLLLGIVSACKQAPSKKQTAKRKKEPKKEETQKKEEAKKGIVFPPTLNNLSFPTDLAFAPDGTLYFTEKGGALKVVKVGKLLPDLLLTIKVPRIFGYNEAGLLGIALSPNFSNDHLIYLYHTYAKDGGLVNRVIRINAERPENEPKVILDNILGGRVHDAGKIQFSPDGHLFIATGDAGQGGLAQRKDSLNGKVLRVNQDGTVAAHNPFPNSAIFSLGHRNIFGMTFDDQGRLYVTENGPEEKDEVNRIERGKNYGWPEVLGFSEDSRFIDPLIVYEEVNAPTGIIFYEGDLLPKLKRRLVFGDYLNGNLHLLSLEDGRATDKVVYDLDQGINALTASSDGAIYAATRTKIIRIDNLP